MERIYKLGSEPGFRTCENPKKYEVGFNGLRSGIQYPTLEKARKYAKKFINDGKKYVCIRKLNGEVKNYRGDMLPNYEMFESVIWDEKNNKFIFRKFKKRG